MGMNYLKVGLVGVMLMSPLGTAFAQDERVEMLERQLRERDKVMLELLDRIEALEKRVGVERSSRDVTEARRPEDVASASEALNQAPGTVIVDARVAERALERALSREGALLLAAGTLEIEPSISFARQEDMTSSFVATGEGVVAGVTESNANRYTVDVSARLGLPWDSQLELGLPYRGTQLDSVTSVGFAPIGSASRSGAGFGDLRIGLAKTLFREKLRRPDLIGRITWDTDTGQDSDNGVPLGGGFHEVQGSLTAVKRQDPVVFIGGLSYQHTFERDQFQPGPVYAVNLGAAYALSPETSLRFALASAYQSESEQFGSAIDGSDRTLGTFILGGSTLLAPGVLLNTSLGIGLTEDSDDFSLTFSVPIRLGQPLF